MKRGYGDEPRGRPSGWPPQAMIRVSAGAPNDEAVQARTFSVLVLAVVVEQLRRLNPAHSTARRWLPSFETSRRRDRSAWFWRVARSLFIQLMLTEQPNGEPAVPPDREVLLEALGPAIRESLPRRHPKTGNSHARYPPHPPRECAAMIMKVFPPK